MKKFKRVLWKTVKWGAICSIGYWLFSVLYFGEGEYDGRKGLIIQRWSGLDALFSDEEFGYITNKPIPTELDGIDGPYVFDSVAYEVITGNVLNKQRINRVEPLWVQVNNDDKDAFQIKLKDRLLLEKTVYEMPEKLLAISDIEGNFNAFYSFLLANGVMDANYQWIFGNGHLVLNGDFVDRGEDVTQVLWLIYMLEEKAKLHGGKVHFILGNHEVMNLNGDARYVQNKYLEVAKLISQKEDWDEATRFLFSEKAELGRWMRTKNVMERIGPYIFVHAGLSKQLVEEKLTIEEINKIAKEYYGVFIKEKPENSADAVVLGSAGPYWFRGMALALKYKLYFMVTNPFNPPFRELSETEVEEIMNYFEADKVVIGHTVVSDISSAYGGRVIKIDLKHGHSKGSGETKGLLIEGGQEYKVDDLGTKELVESPAI